MNPLYSNTEADKTRRRSMAAAQALSDAVAGVIHFSDRTRSPLARKMFAETVLAAAANLLELGWTLQDDRQPNDPDAAFAEGDFYVLYYAIGLATGERFKQQHPYAIGFMERALAVKEKLHRLHDAASKGSS